MKDDDIGRVVLAEHSRWVPVARIRELREKDRMVVKIEKRQIALFYRNDKIYACNNRCPHEGYPLTEGKLGGDCILTCNWHNWKFDLSSGKTVVGGDELTIYETRTEEGEIFVRIVPPDPVGVINKALRGLNQSFDQHEYDRMAREIARVIQAGGDPLDAVRQAIASTYQHFEFGTTHAVAATADWLALVSDSATSLSRRLVALVESIGHFAWDARREGCHSYADGELDYDQSALIAAIEAEDEDRAVCLVRGAYAGGRCYRDIEPALAASALAHYQGFGHSLIYVYKTGQLIERLRDQATAVYLTLMLVRSLIYASREDLIPEFQAYHPTLRAWNGKGSNVPTLADLTTGRLARVLDAISDGGGEVARTFEQIMRAAGWQILHYDMTCQDRTDGPVSQNTGWLDFTHTLTFGNAVRKLCGRYPDLWPQGLLQLGCFLGRNSSHVDVTIDEKDWAVDDGAVFLHRQLESLFDHGQPEYIVSCHLLKVLTALSEDVREGDPSSALPLMLGGVNRFLHSPLKRKHALRTARQALALVASEV